MIMRRNMSCLVMASKHVYNIQAIARKPPITTIEGLLEAVFSVGSTPKAILVSTPGLLALEGAGTDSSLECTFNLSRPVSSVVVSSLACGGGVEYLHRDPASRKRRRKGKSQI
jgi:hypothetical protein